LFSPVKVAADQIAVEQFTSNSNESKYRIVQNDRFMGHMDFFL